MKRRTFFSMIGAWVATCGAAIGLKPDPRSIPNYVVDSPIYSFDDPSAPKWEFLIINKTVEVLRLDDDGNAVVVLKHYDGTEATH